MSGDVQVRFCESLKVGSLRATRLVICFRYEADAIRVKKALGKRLAKYKLKLNEEKTKMVQFSKSKSRQGLKQETFDFLGFTFYLGKTLKGATIPKVKTCGRRYRSKLNKVKAWIKQIKNRMKLERIWEIFCAKFSGHLQYYGVSFNSEAVENFLREAKRIVFKWLNRRSQRKSFDWDKFDLWISKHPLPRAKIYHKLF